jgi:Organic solute transporter Ostalpha
MYASCVSTATTAIVFATFWQSVLIQFLPGVTAEHSLIWNNFILCIECVPFVLLLNHAFPYYEFMTATAADKRVLDSVRQVSHLANSF